MKLFSYAFLYLALSWTAGDALASDGYWDCRRIFTGATTDRKMRGTTKFECGGGLCTDLSHTQPTSWVDIAGGISKTCDNHSSSFYGPYNGEWNGCTLYYGGPWEQSSGGWRNIESVHQSWDRWPDAWWSGHYYIWGCPYVTSSANMKSPFATVYDLDTCLTKDLIGTIYWPNFTIYATKQVEEDCYGDWGYVKYALSGSTGTACSTQSSWCENVVCADLRIGGSFECFFVPQQCGGYDPYCYDEL